MINFSCIIERARKTGFAHVCTINGFHYFIVKSYDGTFVWLYAESS